MRLRLGKIAGKPIPVVRSIEWFSAFWTSNSIYDEAKQYAGADSRPSNREEDPEQHLRVEHDADSNASEQSEQACHEKHGCESINLADSS